MPKRPMPRSIVSTLQRRHQKFGHFSKRIRKVFREAAPQAEETISYGMRHSSSTGVWCTLPLFKNHIGRTHSVRGDRELKRDAAASLETRAIYVSRLGNPSRTGLIRRIVKNRVLAQQSKA